MRLHALPRVVATAAGLCLFLSTTSALAAPILNLDNGHYYEFFESPLGYAVTWWEAAAAADGSSHLDLPGHLVTITSREENLWLTTTYGAPALRSKWTGGMQVPGAPSPELGWFWITGEPWSYANWYPPGAPNDGSGEDEDRVQFDLAVNLDGIGWNDYVAHGVANGYLIEYEPAFGAVPEPGSCALLGLGWWVVWRRRAATV